VILEDGEIRDIYYAYHSFGDLMENSYADSTQQSYKYTGKPLDRENGAELYYYGARYYDADLGRFIAVDPAQNKYPGRS